MDTLSEVAYFTANVEAMAQFYKMLLDVEPVASSPTMAIFLIGNTKLFIHAIYTPNQNELPPENHIAFTVDDVDHSCAKLVQQGLILEVSPQNYYWGRSAYLRDPDGHLIELNQTTP